MPGITDGYGMEADHISKIEYYQDFVSGTDTRRKKRGGPVNLTPEQRATLVGFLTMVQVNDTSLADGTGYMLLFDLQGKETCRWSG